jgi:hypothetical protein
MKKQFLQKQAPLKQLLILKDKKSKMYHTPN